MWTSSSRDSVNEPYLSKQQAEYRVLYGVQDTFVQSVLGPCSHAQAKL